jgi:transposase
MANRSRGSDAGSRMEPDLQLTNEQWQQIADIFPHESPGPQGGRPRVEPRACIEGILWVLVSGARWKDLPRRFPSYATCWRRFKAWTEAGLWQKAWSRLVHKLDRLGQIDWEQSLADGTFSPAKKGVIA